MQSNTAPVENRSINFPNFPVEKKRYKSDHFTISDGRCIGSDGFVVPSDFEEFYERFPDYVRKWVSKHTVHRTVEPFRINGKGRVPSCRVPSCLSGHDCGLLRRNFALDKVGGLLGLRRGGNQQPRIRLEPCNPRVEIGG